MSKRDVDKREAKNRRNLEAENRRNEEKRNDREEANQKQPAIYKLDGRVSDLMNRVTELENGGLRGGRWVKGTRESFKGVLGMVWCAERLLYVLWDCSGGGW